MHVLDVALKCHRLLHVVVVVVVAVVFVVSAAAAAAVILFGTRNCPSISSSCPCLSQLNSL